MNKNYFSLLILFYLFSTRNEINIILPENFLTDQENCKDFQQTLLYINNDEKRFLQNIYKILMLKKTLQPATKAMLEKFLSRKDIIVTNKPGYFLKKLPIQSLDKNKIEKEGIITIIEIIQPLEKEENRFDIKIKIFDKKSIKVNSSENPSFWCSVNNWSENSFKQNFLR